MTRRAASDTEQASRLVLVIDDEPTTASTTAATVRELGYRAIVSTTWTDALRVFGNGCVDLVLMDAVMPTVDGFKLTKMLRDRAKTYVPIVFLTGLTDSSSRARGVSVGADDFLNKPIDRFELQIRLTAMLRIRSLTQALEQKSQALARLASVDGLTGVSNRRSFDTRLAAEVERATTFERSLALLILDIDHFKRVNDNFGHAVGDQLLASFGRLLSEMTRADDEAFRYGGEEFAILALDTNAQQASHLAQRIRNSFALRTYEATACGSQTVSIGICGLEQLQNPDPTSMIVAADRALYAAKASGRNCVRTYDPLSSPLPNDTPKTGT